MQINENFSLKNIGYNPISVDETETPEAGGAAWRLYPNDIRDKCIIAAKCDKNTNYLHISEKSTIFAAKFKLAYCGLMTIAIFGNALKANTLIEVRHILQFMTERGVHVMLSQELRQELDLREYPSFPENWDGEKQPENIYGEPIDFALSVGGDGTFLTSAAAIGNKNIPILGVNCGHLGFLAEVQANDLDAILNQLVAGQYTIEQRSLLNLSILDKDGIMREGLIMSPNALNEIAILKQGLTNMLTIETQVNGELLHRYHSDGLVIATPTGSTAYNLSIGGPLVVPQSKGILLTPIAPHSLTVRPIIVPDDWKFDIQVSSRYDSYMVSVDGRSQSLSTDMRLHIERAPYTVKVVQIGDNSFLKSLRNKLNWGK